MNDTDPIEEIHEIRRKLMEKAGGTPEAYVRHIMEQQKLNPDGLVDLSKPTATQKKPRRKPAKPAATTKVSARKQRQRHISHPHAYGFQT